MKLSLVIPTHNRFNNIVLLIHSIQKQDLTNLDIEVIVVSNLSDKKLQNFLSTTPFRYYESGHIGVNFARNKGISESKGDWIYFLDDDVILRNPEHLQQTFQIAKANADMAAIGGSYTLSSNARSIDYAYHTIATNWISDKKGQLVGGNTLYHSSLLKNKLFFNEEIIFGGSETELNLRIINDGGKFLFTDKLTLEHNTNLNLFMLARKAIRQGEGRALHEKIAPPAFWSKSDKNSEENFYLDFYNFFFHVGYRKKTTHQSLPVSMLKTFLQIDADKILNIPSDEKAFHEYSRPKLKFRELHHWLKAHFWWKIPHTLFWKIIPGIGNVILDLMPFDSTNIRKFYYKIFQKI